MRLPRAWIPMIARTIVDSIVKSDAATFKADKSAVTDAINEIVLSELMVEDRLNEEVREILKKFEADIEKGRLDYKQLFDLTKKKLVRERNIIL
jgi:hypothetical protein